MLVSVEIENFRKFDRYRLDLSDRNLLVGPNNAGKSTVVEALRLVSVVVNRLGNLNPEPAPAWFDDDAIRMGVYPSLRGLDFLLGRETFNHYSDPPAKISAELASGTRVDVYIGPDTEVFATARTRDGTAITTKREARQLERIGIQPQVGPVSPAERELADRYVRSALDSSLAPIHFRNQLRVLSSYFDDFKALAEQSWPGLALDRLESVGLGKDRRLALFLRDGGFVGELSAMGHGLQMWLQLMWFLVRSSHDATVVLDEPDVYMHPDLQRRLIRILFRRNQQVVVATHSVEMMAEVEPDEIVTIDASERRGRAATKIADIQRVVDQIGGVHNIEFARLARAEQCLVTPSGDRRLLARWFDALDPSARAGLDALPFFRCESWAEWPYVVAFKRAVDQLRPTPIRLVCLLPGLSIPRLFADCHGEAAREGIDLHVWGRRGLLSFAFDPYVVARIVSSHGAGVAPESIAAGIDAIAGEVRREARAHAADLSAIVKQPAVTDREFNDAWESPARRIGLLSPRLVGLRLFAWINQVQQVKLGIRDVTAAFGHDDLHPEVGEVLASIAHGEPLPKNTSAHEAPWPSAVDTPDSLRSSEPLEVLDLLDAAGVFD